MQNNNENVNNSVQDETALLIETVSQDILNSLKEGNGNIDIEPLMNAIQTYSSFPNYNKAAVERWKGRIAEITAILEEEYKKVEAELKQLMENDRKLDAYGKAQSTQEDEQK
ncbi:MAG UNVERIFIED_CONTAM: hypothetical protein LVQ98_08170 [Rickettsiaceae bacterium]|jgi:hypothetical protein